jgi:hypothetical protein
MVSPLQQKIRVSGPVVITANRLSDGAVVHRTAAGQWSEALDDAQILWSTEEARNALKTAQGDGLEAVGPYVAPIETSEASAQPGNIREFIRISGPTFVLPSDTGAAYLWRGEVGKTAT